jgi:hypothetical protein
LIGQYRLKSFFVVLLVLLSYGAANGMVLPVSWPQGGNSYSKASTEMTSSGSCSESSLEFDVRTWDEINSDHLFVGFSDVYEGNHLAFAANGNTSNDHINYLGGAFGAEYNGSNKLSLCINEDFRLKLMYSMAKEEINDTIDGAMIPEEDIVYLIAEGGIYLNNALKIGFSSNFVSLVAYLGYEFTKMEAAILTMEDYRRAADRHIEKKIFIWYTGTLNSSSSTNYGSYFGVDDDNPSGIIVYPTPTLTHDPGDSGTALDGPDANVKRVEIDNTGNNWHHSYTADPGQTLQVRVKVSNKGDEPIDYLEVFIHRSDDQDFGKDTDHSYGREEGEDDLDPGESDYKHRAITAPNTPGTYYIFAYINRVDGEEGGDDQDWDNNISRDDDPEEYAILTVKKPGPTPQQKAAAMMIIQTMILND